KTIIYILRYLTIIRSNIILVFYLSCNPRDLHSFPTRRSSDLSAMETGKPVSSRMRLSRFFSSAPPPVSTMPRSLMSAESSGGVRSEEHTSELQSLAYLVCRLLLEKKKNNRSSIQLSQLIILST